MLLASAPKQFPDALRLDSGPQPEITVESAGATHGLLRDAIDDRQFWVSPQTPVAAPLAAIIPLDRAVPIRVDAVLRLWQRLVGQATPPAAAPLTQQKRRRMILMVRALDGWQHRASYRDLAAALLDTDVLRQSRREWQTSSRRAQIIRIVRDAIRHRDGGYRDLLGGR